MIRWVFLVVWAAVNLTAFALYGMDKRRAIRGAWRIPERTLIAIALLLGGVGALAGMQVFRHKTKHLSFRICVPLGAAISLAALAAAMVHLG